MSITYAQKNKNAVQTKRESSVSIIDSSSQSESLQRKADMANNAAQRAEAPRPNNTGMPDNLKSGIESLSGFSMDDVRVHYNSSKPATVQALAYTQGTDIHVAPGQEKHLPHEAWHVAQQMAGRVSPTTNINGMPVNDNAGLEREADVMGEMAVQCEFENKNLYKKDVIESGIQCHFPKNQKWQKKQIIEKMTSYFKLHKVVAEEKIPSVVDAAISRMECDETTYTSDNWESFLKKDDTLKSLLAKDEIGENNPQKIVKEDLEKKSKSDSTFEHKDKKVEKNVDCVCTKPEDIWLTDVISDVPRKKAKDEIILNGFLVHSDDGLSFVEKEKKERPILGFDPKGPDILSKLNNTDEKQRPTMHQYYTAWINPNGDERRMYQSLIENGFGRLNGVCFDFQSTSEPNMSRAWYFYIPMKMKKFTLIKSPLSNLRSPVKVAFYKSDDGIILQCFSTTSEVDILSPITGLEIHVFDRKDGKYVEVCK
ncbi:MAG: DUF4157 domain-containing protein [Fibrobacter sp.]|nr:DUF4157 domain-containing protein [Fibrobacter sp.]